MVEITLGCVGTRPGSTRDYKTGAWRAMRPIVNGEKCISCGQCWQFCPEGCIQKKETHFEADLDYCKGCGICANQCPVKCIEMKMEEK